MAYSELVKRFDLVRNYMRDFLIFGFKTRTSFSQKSARTYDNERRRIESWLGGVLRWEYHAGGKTVFLSLDAAALEQNPLCRAWQSKSFTDNDITLHFYLLDLLGGGVPRHAEEITDALSGQYGQLFELPTVRRKLKEYTALGLLDAQKQGRRVYYTLCPCSLAGLFPDQTNLPELLCFFGEAAPLAAVGSFLKGRMRGGNPYFRFKHHFIVHTLEDQILLAALQAIQRGERLEVTSVSGRNGRESVCQVVPAKILASTQNGRRYLAAWRLDRWQPASLRLDYIKSLTPCPAQEGDGVLRNAVSMRLPHTWGAALSGQPRRKKFAMTIAVDEAREPYIIQRLRREGRGGRVEPVQPGLWRYSTEVYDMNEMMGWVKTFLGRIVSLEGDDQAAVQRFARDVRRMADLYGEGE